MVLMLNSRQNKIQTGSSSDEEEEEEVDAPAIFLF